MNKTTITDPQDIINYLKGGTAEFTLKSTRTGSHHTYKFVRMPIGNAFFARHLTGADNEHDFSYLCVVPANVTKTISTKGSPGSSNAIAALDWFLRCLASKCDKLAQVEFYHTGKCSACGRKLTTPESVERGMGPVCRQRVRG